MKAGSAGPNCYFALGNFTQRIDLVQAAVQSTLTNATHRKIAAALFTKIRRIWKTRNYLIHSHYVYVAEFEDGTYSAMIGMGKDRGFHGDKPRAPRPQSYWQNPDGTREYISQPKLVQEGYAYEKRDNGKKTYHFVNKGTFANHAEQVYRRTRQIDLLCHAIRHGRTPIVKPESWRQKSPSRSRPDRQ
jgi:hypothetical protein